MYLGMKKKCVNQRGTRLLFPLLSLHPWLLTALVALAYRARRTSFTNTMRCSTLHSHAGSTGRDAAVGAWCCDAAANTGERLAVIVVVADVVRLTVWAGAFATMSTDVFHLRVLVSPGYFVLGCYVALVKDPTPTASPSVAVVDAAAGFEDVATMVLFSFTARGTFDFLAPVQTRLEAELLPAVGIIFLIIVNVIVILVHTKASFTTAPPPY